MNKNDRWTPRTSIAHLAKSHLFDSLTSMQLAVYLKLLGECGARKTSSLRVLNREVWRDARTATRTLAELEQLGLIKIARDETKFGRTIEVL